MKTAGIICPCQGDNFLLRKYYVEMLHDLGLAAALMPVGSPLPLDHLDLLVLAGGGDIHSSFFGAQLIPQLRTIDPERDAYEIRLCRQAVGMQLPVLAICRGMQVLNVALGGSLIQHLDSKRLHNHDENNHYVQVADDDFAKVAGTNRFAVNSFHHQAVGDIPPCLQPILYSDDGIVEGIRGGSFPALGLQFHPERIYKKSAATHRILTDFLEKL